MIHTMILSTPVSLELLEKVATKLRVEIKEKKNSTVFYSKQGFREIALLKVSIRGAIYSAIEIRLNPKVMLTDKKDLNVIGVSDISKVEDVFNNKLGVILGYNLMKELPRFNNWICKRIDYAVDIKTIYVEEYIKLFQRVQIPNIYFESMNKKQGSAYISSKSVTLNFYDKEDEINKKLEDEDININESGIEEMEDVLRLEIQCKKSKINYMKSRKGLPNNTIRNFFNPDIAIDTILSYYDSTIGSGDFYSLNEAEKIIKNQKNISERSKNALIKVLKLIAQTRSVDEAKKQFIEGVTLKNTNIQLKGTARTFNKHLKKLRELGINPVTIPRGWQIGRLENLRELIISAFNNM